MVVPPSPRAESLASLEDLFDAHHRRALGYAYQMVHNRADAEDVVQEAFLSAWRARVVYDPERGSERTWLLTLVRNRAISLLRARGCRPITADEEYDELPDAGDLAEEVAMRVDGAVLRAAVARLPQAQRRVLELAYFGGLSHAEIAHQLNAPLGTVKGRVRLGIDRLRSTMGTGSGGTPAALRPTLKAS